MRRRRFLITIFALLTVIAAVTGVIDSTGERYADAAFKRALVTFAIARTLNGAISVAQGTELALEPAGVGVILTVGQVLDPVNDLIERFSAIMLVAASSLGLQNVMLDILSWWGVSAALLLSASFVLVCVWLPRLRNSRTEKLGIRVLLLVVFLRFAMPLLIIGTNLVFDTFLEAEQAAAVEALEVTQSEIEQLNEETSPPPPVEEQSLIDQLGSMLDESLQSINVGDRLDNLRQRASEAIEHIINLIVIFMLQTVILPVVFLWLLAQLASAVAARATRV